MSTVLLNSVFGSSPKPELRSYVRRSMEQDFISAIEARQHEAIAVYGSSKQGKTWLKHHALLGKQVLQVTCTTGMSIADIYNKLLVSANFKTEKSQERGGTAKTEVKVGLGTLLKAAFGVDASAIVEKSQKTVLSYTEPNMTSPDAVANALASCTSARIIVLDNFHHLSDDRQKEFCSHIRVLSEAGFLTIVIGIWYEPNYLQDLSPRNELTGRVKSLHIEPWSRADLARVLEAGSKALNVEMSGDVCATLVEESLGNVGLLQKLCYRYLESEGVTSSERELRRLSAVRSVAHASSLIGEEERDALAGRLRQVADTGNSFAGGKSRAYWILRAYLRTGKRDIMDGIALKQFENLTNQVLQSNGHRVCIEPASFTSLVRNQLPNRMQQLLGDPLFVCQKTDNVIRIVDKFAAHAILHHDEYIAKKMQPSLDKSTPDSHNFSTGNIESFESQGRRQLLGRVFARFRCKGLK